MEHKETRPFRGMVVLGESTVQGGGWLVDKGERWPDILHNLLEVAQEEPLNYHNAGLGASVISPRSPGYEASVKPSASERLEKEVISLGPDLVVIAYGLNDMRAGMPLEDFKEEMEKLLEKIRQKLSPTIVVANVYHMRSFEFYPPFNRGSLKATKAYNRMLRDLARERKCIYADIWSAQGRKDHVVHQDTVHANKIGNILIANKAFEAIVQACPGISKNVLERDAETEWTKSCIQIQRTGSRPNPTASN